MMRSQTLRRIGWFGALAVSLVVAVPGLAQGISPIEKRVVDLETLSQQQAKSLKALQSLVEAQQAKIQDLDAKLAAEVKTRAEQDTLLTHSLRQYIDVQVGQISASVETGDTATFQRAKQYTDASAAITLQSSRRYADTKAEATVKSANAYTISKLEPVADKLVHLGRVGNDLYITGANVHIRNGQTWTWGNDNGLGNLIIGYNEISKGIPMPRTGSHNLVIGAYHSYTSSASLVAGFQNTTSASFSAVLGGSQNEASGHSSSILGGYDNVAAGGWSTILGRRHQRTTTEAEIAPW
ncbi:MAG: hypothetical protein JNK85_06070 [Verrucomicrobiales bacterium]|nr:hypothetical protein [Verrucomicrobiales bacterium]